MVPPVSSLAGRIGLLSLVALLKAWEPVVLALLFCSAKTARLLAAAAAAADKGLLVVAAEIRAQVVAAEKGLRAVAAERGAQEMGESSEPFWPMWLRCAGH